MRRRGLSVLAAVGFLLLSGRCLAAPAERDQGRIVTVYDGDTVRIRFADGTLRKVRLIGIDSPELSDSREAVRFMALMAKRFAFLELFRKEVRLAYDWQLEDKYGRLLAYIYEGDGGLFNERILREGFASVYRVFPYDDALRKRFEAAEKEAREGERGLWRKDRPTEIAPGEARDHLGRLVSVRMTCSRIEVRGSFTVLHSPDDGFEVLVPKADRPSFPGLDALEGKPILVQGLVEEYKGCLQIMIYLPMQLEAGRLSPVSAVVPGKRFTGVSRPALTSKCP